MVFQLQVNLISQLKLTNKYIFSFTGNSLRLKEMILIAAHLRSEADFDVVEQIGGGRRKTAITIYNECKNRLSYLTPDQTTLLINGDLAAKRQMAFLAMCKFHAFIRDFTVEVVREKYLLFDYTLTKGDYFSFFRSKLELHPNMEKLTNSSQDSVRQVTFKVLEQAGIIDNIRSMQIQLQMLSSDVFRVIAEDQPDLLKIFLVSDLEIRNAMTQYGKHF